MPPHPPSRHVTKKKYHVVPSSYKDAHHPPTVKRWLPDTVDVCKDSDPSTWPTKTDVSSVYWIWKSNLSNDVKPHPVAVNSCTNVVLPKPAKTVINADTAAATSMIPTIPTTILSASTAKLSEPTKVSPNPKTMTTRSGKWPPNYEVPHGSNEVEMPSLSGDTVPGPTMHTHPTRRHGDVYPITLTSPPGSCSGSIWIGSFPPMWNNPCHCTSTGLCTHPFQPCPVSGKPSTVCSTVSSLLKPASASHLSGTGYTSTTLQTYPDIKISPTHTIATKSESFINA